MIANTRKELEQAFPLGSRVVSDWHGVNIIEGYGDFGGSFSGHGRWYLYLTKVSDGSKHGAWPRYCRIDIPSSEFEQSIIDYIRVEKAELGI
jgi:hypothetical protein